MKILISNFIKIRQEPDIRLSSFYGLRQTPEADTVVGWNMQPIIIHY
jgi:hypothetical protein